MNADEALTELKDRLERAHNSLMGIYADALHDLSGDRAGRVHAKADGVALALAYLNDVQLLVDIQPGST